MTTENSKHNPTDTEQEQYQNMLCILPVVGDPAKDPDGFLQASVDMFCRAHPNMRVTDDNYTQLTVLLMALSTRIQGEEI